MAGKFEIYRDRGGEFRFRLKAGNGQTILASQGYKTKAGCLNAIESVRKNAITEARFSRKEATNGRRYFSLRARNGRTIGTSEGYENASSREDGIRSVILNAPEAAIDFPQHDAKTSIVHHRSAAIEAKSSFKTRASVQRTAERDSEALIRLAKR